MGNGGTSLSCWPPLHPGILGGTVGTPKYHVIVPTKQSCEGKYTIVPKSGVLVPIQFQTTRHFKLFTFHFVFPDTPVNNFPLKKGPTTYFPYQLFQSDLLISQMEGHLRKGHLCVQTRSL